ncbi:MAG: MBL fold metallo-hydrolase [Dethiobacteria bacterium]|jgi:7,8-dihydropterin-6-yl-methyl-4-(beta-D-ribofuranosyl)aminobenzene 5'-phosphate synthase
MDQAEILTLVDNCAAYPGRSGERLLGEHGLSFLLSYRGKRVLFDTGSGLTIGPNMQSLEIRGEGIDTIILSHGHQDHCGGLDTVLMRTGGADVYVHPYIFKPKYIIKKGKEPYFFGFPQAKDKYASRGARFILREEKMQPLAEGIYIFGPVERRKPADDPQLPNRYIKEDGDYKPDLFLDEQVLVLKTAEGLFLVLGCTHNGLENTLEQVREEMQEERIYGLIGGLHLSEAEPSRVRELALYLRELGIKVLGCAHCTGFEATMQLRQLLGEGVFLNYVGKKLTVPF